mmetsp:Transcript_65957/g.208785  ORF Transcript_65957/g.208785 Transcript_65957/m.208785 type:complete len:235 (+) Transcript_65957:299-1003(+)
MHGRCNDSIRDFRVRWRAEGCQAPGLQDHPAQVGASGGRDLHGRCVLHLGGGDPPPRHRLRQCPPAPAQRGGGGAGARATRCPERGASSSPAAPGRYGPAAVHRAPPPRRAPGRSPAHPPPAEARGRQAQGERGPGPGVVLLVFPLGPAPGGPHPRAALAVLQPGRLPRGSHGPRGEGRGCGGAPDAARGLPPRGRATPGLRNGCALQLPPLLAPPGHGGSGGRGRGGPRAGHR